jgi:hypothetical protein
MHLPDGTAVAIVMGAGAATTASPSRPCFRQPIGRSAGVRARELGLQSPIISSFALPTAEDAALASDGQVRWRLWPDDTAWRPQTELSDAS